MKMFVRKCSIVCIFTTISTLCVPTGTVSNRVTGSPELSDDGCQKSFYLHEDMMIMSPSFPSPYGDNLTCEYSISVSSSFSILLLFSSFSLEPSPVCIYDSLKIYDGKDKLSSPLLRNLCGDDSLPSPVFSSGDHLLLVFRSDSCVSTRGFQAFTHIIDTNQTFENECPESFDSNGQTVTSPLFPSNYENEQTCEYSIQAPSTYVILLLFSDFSLETSKDCILDSLKIYDGNSKKHPLLETLCGNTSLPLPVLSSGSSLTLVFKTDRIVTASGFRAFSHFIESTKSPKPSSAQIICLVVLSMGVGIVITCILSIIRCRMRRKVHLIRQPTLPAPPTIARFHSQSYEYIPYKGNLQEFSRSRLNILECIGSGEFGSVHMGKALGILQPNVEESVAVKRIKDNASITERRGFCLELEIYKALEFHPNIVSMYGFCTTSDPLCIILEYLSKGNLHKYLKKLLQFQGLEDTLANSLNLMMFALQISKGMDYLASKNYVHGDLMVKNILLSSTFVCKISNFGRTRDMTDREELELDVVELHSVRWTAPEKILDCICTKACDVWSFGVVLWELVTLGSYPYQEMSTKQMVESINSGYRFPQPDYCNDEIYEIMTKCLERDPVNRPNFSQLRSTFDEIMDKNKNYLLLEGSTNMVYSRRVYESHHGSMDQSPKNYLLLEGSTNMVYSRRVYESHHGSMDQSPKDYLPMEGSTDKMYSRRVYESHQRSTDRLPEVEYDSIELTPISSK